MSIESKILWKEGLFLCPQTFQQQERYLSHQLEQRTRYLEPYFWGVVELSIDQEQLQSGIFSLESCKGVFPDGTPFDIGESQLDLHISDNASGKLVYLAVGVSSNAIQQVTSDTEKNEYRTRRYIDTHQTYNDVETLDSPDKTESIEQGKLNFQLFISDSPQSNYTQIAIAKIKEQSGDQRAIKLDNDYIPPVLFTHSSSNVLRYVKRVQQQLDIRSEALASRLSNPSAGGISDISDFNMLQIMNRNRPLFDYLCQEERLHPHKLYLYFLQLVGELATFASSSRRPDKYSPYLHDNLERTFFQLFEDIHQYLQYSAIPKALSIPLHRAKDYPVYQSAQLMESVFTDHVRFILMASADVSQSELQSKLPKIVKIASTIDHLSELVRTVVSGVELEALQTVPRDIPYYTSSVYFELLYENSGSKVHWQKIVHSRNICLHVDGIIAGLKLEIWAIRGDQ